MNGRGMNFAPNPSAKSMGIFVLFSGMWGASTELILAAAVHNPTQLSAFRIASLALYIIVLGLAVINFLQGLLKKQTGAVAAPRVTDDAPGKELRETRDFLEKLIGHANAPIIVWNTDNNITRFNRAFERLTGYTADEVVSHNLEMLFPPASRLVSMQEIGRTVGGEYWESVEIPILCKSGETRFVLWNSANIYADNDEDLQATIAQGVDVTERNKVNHELSETRDFLEKLIGYANAPIIVWNTDNQITRFNRAFERLTGYTAAEMIDRRLDILFPPASRHDSMLEIERTMGGEYWETVEIPILCRDGETRLVLWNSANIYGDNEDELQATIAQGVDITDRIMAENEREKLQEQILHKQKLESLGVLAGGVAHDFNNILMAILGNACLIRNELPVESKVLHDVQEIETAARRAADLCKQMLAYSGKGKFVISAIDLSELVGEMTSMLEVSISKKVHLEKHFATEIFPIWADPTQIRQVVMNLITNASEAIGDDEGTIIITTRVQECTEAYLRETFPQDVLEAGPYVCLEVKDNGCGMDEKTQSRIFDPFYTTKFTGRGLGLAALLGIVRGHSGAIQVLSKPGEGSCFTVVFPAATETKIIKSAEGRRESEKWIAQGTVLLVDDEESILNVGSRMLLKMGFSVLTADHGRDALEVYREHEADIRCIVMDLTMPQMGGDQAFQEIRKINDSVPIIISSGYNENEIAPRFDGKGLAGFIQKPYQLQDLVEVVKDALGTQES